nr:transposase (putative), gypsy type [Tanacetum cinerariifolium]
MGKNHGNHKDVTGFVDSDYAKDPDKGRSITGYAFLVHGCVVSWKATLQYVVALSTTEAEYMALTKAVKEAIWLTGLLEELEVLEAKTVEVLKVGTEHNVADALTKVRPCTKKEGTVSLTVGADPTIGLWRENQNAISRVMCVLGFSVIPPLLDSVQLETTVNTISHEYLLEFTSEYGISEMLHPELPGPGDKIVDFPEGKVGWMSFSKRPGKNTPQCYTKPLDSLKNWNNCFFWVDECVFPTVVDWRTNASKDGMPVNGTYSVKAVRALDTHRTPIQKQPEMLLCLVGISRRYYLEDEVYPTFHYDDDWEIDLFSLIRAPNPTKVKTGSRPRAPHEVPLLTLTAARVIEMDELTATTDSSSVLSAVEKSSLDFTHEDGASDQGTTAPEVPPPEDVFAPAAPEVGQSEGAVVAEPPVARESLNVAQNGPIQLNTCSQSDKGEDREPPPCGDGSSGVPSAIEKSPLDFADEAEASGQETVAPEVPPPEEVPITTVPGGNQAAPVAVEPPVVQESRKRGHEGINANAPPKSLRRDHADLRPSGVPADVSDPDPLAFTDAPSPHPADVVRSSQGVAVAGDPGSENVSSPTEVGSPGS